MVSEENKLVAADLSALDGEGMGGTFEGVVMSDHNDEGWIASSSYC